MVKFTVEQLRKIMDYPHNIRNMTVIAHVDHGKSTLSDALVCKAGIISEEVAGKARILDLREDEIERGITIKSTGVSLHYKFSLDGKEEEEYIINLIDSPGHVDFSSQVTAALRVTDGALVIVDTVEGVCVQTETVLRQAMQERIRPLLMINKVDRAIGELQLSGEEIYQQFSRVVEKVNFVIETYQSEDMGSLEMQPSLGNVIFGAGKDQWAFTLKTFAKFYQKKFAMEQDALLEKLWGDNFYDEKTNKWTDQSVSSSGEPLKRTFVQYIMDPICKMCEIIRTENKAALEEMLEKFGVVLTQENMKTVKSPKDLQKLVMSRWLPAADCLLETMILRLPSPVVAQKYRTPYLYEGPMEDDTAQSMMQCNPKGPLCVYISKMIPIDGGRFAAFGRVFSGTVRSGEKIRIMGPSYKHNQKHDLFEKSVGQVGIYMMGKLPEFVPDVPCGNTVALIGIDEYLQKTGTLSNNPETYPIRSMKYSVSAVYRVAVKPKKAQDIAVLQKALTKLSKSDPLLKCQIEATGEIILAGSGELHIEICINDLRKYAQCELIVSAPTVTYRQTITSSVSEPLLTKSTNKHNRLFGTTDLVKEELVRCLEQGTISDRDDVKQRAKRLVNEFDWDKNQAVKIWSFEASNVLVDCVKEAQYVNQIKESIVSAFQDASRSGVLAGEELRGCRFSIVDAKIHPDAVHRNGAQIIPAAKSLFQGLQLASTPTLLEPIFFCEITAPFQVLGGVYNTISQRRGVVFEEQKMQGSPLHIIKAYLPVAESFGFTSVLRANTQGMAFPQCSFDHWDKITGTPYVDAKANQLVMSIRSRKGMKAELPILATYIDKL